MVNTAFFGFTKYKKIFTYLTSNGCYRRCKCNNRKKKQKWWVFYNKPNSYLFGEFPLNIGPFLIGSIWILKWTYGNFIRFTLLNPIVNAFFAFPFSVFAKKARYYSLVRINGLQFFLYFFSKAFLFYWIQFILEKKASKYWFSRFL